MACHKRTNTAKQDTLACQTKPIHTMHHRLAYLYFILFTFCAHAAEINLNTATVLDLQQAYDEGLSSEQVVEAYLKRIEAFDQAGPKLNAILTINPDAIKIARSLDAERKISGPRSPLHGVPFIIKDNYDTFDMPTTGGAIALKGTTPERDAHTVKRLRDAGAIIFAKTNLDEFARGATGTSSLGGQVLNPYNLDKIPGGSSGGSGVGVTALFGWIGMGTETGSSIRNPSTKANLVGFSPSQGLVSRGGIIPISITYDRAGPMARNVTDAAIAMGTLAGTDAGDLFSYAGLGHTPSDHYISALQKDGLKGARIGVMRELFGTDPEDQPAVDLIEAAIAKMKSEGAIIIDPLPANVDVWELVRATNYGRYENRAAMEVYFAMRESDFPYSTLPELVISGGILGRLNDRYAQEQAAADMTGNNAYINLYRGRETMRNFVHELMDRWQLDAIVYPHETKPVLTIADAVSDNGNSPNPSRERKRGEGNRISTVTGLPTLTVPAGFNTDGVPVGIEFLGRLFDEATIIRIAYAYEQAHPQRKLPATTPLIGVETLSY
jgi:amidase